MLPDPSGMILTVDLQEIDVFSTGEAVVRAWSNGNTEGIPVLICNGLGAGPQCWPGLADDPECGYHVIGFHHRGTAGSGRPYLEGHTYIADHAADAYEVLNALDIESAIVVGWSIGVSVAYELAATHPDRVAALLSVCGLPDPTIGAVGYPLGVTSSVTQAVTSGTQAALKVLPSPILSVLDRVPVSPTTISLLTRTGFLSAQTDPAVVEGALKYYLAHDPEWYLTLAKSAAEHSPPDLSQVTCPALMLAAKRDVFLPAVQVTQYAQKLPNTDVRVVSGSHFLPLESPELIREAIAAVAERTPDDTDLH